MRTCTTYTFWIFDKRWIAGFVRKLHRLWIKFYEFTPFPIFVI